MSHLRPVGRALGLALIALVLVATPVHADNCSAAAYGADAPAGQDGACGDTAGAAGWLAAALAGIAGLLTFGGGGRGPWAEGSDFSALKETSRDLRRQQGHPWTAYFAHGMELHGNRAADFARVLTDGDERAMDRLIDSYENPDIYGDFWQGQDGPAASKPENVGEWASGRKRGDPKRGDDDLPPGP